MAHEWTIKTLKEYFDALRADDRRAIDAALASADRANLKAENATEKRFESVNEFRQTLTDQAGTFVSRVEFDGLKERMDRNDGRSTGISSLWGVIIGAGGLMAALVTVIAFFVIRQPVT